MNREPTDETTDGTAETETTDDAADAGPTDGPASKTPADGTAGDGDDPVPDGGVGTRTARHPDETEEPAFGETWVYESIVSALPGANLAGAPAIALQLGVFLGAMVIVAAAYGLWQAVVPGVAAVAVAAVGSYLMLRLSEASRTAAAPSRYYRLLFGSSIEVVLAVLAFIALITHLFVYEPQFAGEAPPLAAILPLPVDPATEPLVTALFGEEPPVVAVYLTLLVLWDLCYRIGTSWWAAVVSLYRELRLSDGTETATFRRLDVLNVGFAATQTLLLPFLLDRPVLLVAVGGHVGAVVVVSGAAVLLSLRND